MDPLTLNMFVFVILLVIFFIIGSLSFNPKANLGEFFLINRNLSSKDYSQSFIASSTSLATVFFSLSSSAEDMVYIYYSLQSPILLAR